MCSFRSAADRKLPQGAVAVGDEIIAVNRNPVTTLLDYERALVPLKPGQYAPIGVLHGGATNEVVTQLVALPKPDGAKLAHDRLGLELKPFSEIKGSATLARQGVAIASVRPSSVASLARLLPGLIVARINGADVATLDDIGALLEHVNAGDPVELVVVNLREQQGFLVSQSAQVNLKAE